MDISVPSRFACLNIEDDDFRSGSSNNPRKKIDKAPKKTSTSKKSSPPVSHQPSISKPNSSNTRKKNKQFEKQWEEWKRKDSEMVDDSFEQDMQNAILQSKLDFETRKNVSSVSTVPAEKDKQTATNGAKKKKNKTMNLAEFLEGPDKHQNNGQSEDKNVYEEVDSEAFFEKMMEAAKKEVTKGRIEEQRKERDINFEKTITLAQCQEKLKQEQIHSAELQEQLDEARAEVAAVKARNKMLCSILGHGEMRDKAEVLLELDRLNTVKDELTEEVAHLHKLLEQERSKTAALTLDSQSSKHTKDKKRKKNGC